MIRILLSVLLATCSFPLLGQEYPSQIIRLVVPASAGGSADLIAREFGRRLSTNIGQSVLIDNRPGAATNLGSEAVLRSAPDGYTLLLGVNVLIANTFVGPEPNFNVAVDLAPIGLMVRQPVILSSNSKSRFNSVGELPGVTNGTADALTVGSGIPSSVEHLKANTPLKLLNVPYKGGADAIVALLGQHTDLALTAAAPLLPHLKSGSLKGLAIASKKRLASFPTIPTFHESGLNYEAGVWYALFAPPKTPMSVINKLSSEMKKIVEEPGFIAVAETMGGIVDFSAPAQLHSQILSELKEWKAVAEKSNSNTK